MTFYSVPPLDICFGWHVIRDGQAWCAIGPEFDDLEVNIVGWGSTPQAARDMLSSQYGGELAVPDLIDFQVHGL